MKKAMVFGAGVSGKGAERLLKELSYEVYLVDDKVAISSEEAIEIMDSEKIELFVKSPGTPYNDLVKKIMVNNIELIDEIELGYRYKVLKNISGKIIAITGTNGKTTVTSKITELLNKAGYRAEFCGNIGVSFGEKLLEKRELDFYVLELSSYQLENLKEFKADIAMVINLVPDHLTRYRDEVEYYDTKFNIGKNQTDEDYFIVNELSDEILKRVDKINAKKIVISEKNKGDIYSSEGVIYYREQPIIEEKNLALKGKHNLENCYFIIAVAKILDISNELIKEFLSTTKTLEHRMEEFFEYGKIKFVNDSKATNIESTNFAIEAYKNPILICGGYDKKLNLMPLIQKINELVKEVFLIGAISDEIEQELREIGYRSSKIHNLRDIESVIKYLRKNLNPNRQETILFSPATSSFDQFKDFEERGETFKTIVKNIFGEEGKSKNKKVLITTGGTGGHIYPALAVGKKLIENGVDVLFVGSNSRMEKELVLNEGVRFKGIDIYPFKRIGRLFSNIKAFIQALKIMKREKPDAVMGFGNYISIPILLMAVLFRKKIYLQEQNVKLGMANRFFYKYAKKCFLAFDETFEDIPIKNQHKFMVTGNPLRASIYSLSKEEEKERLKIGKNEKILLITGGSLGATSINSAVIRKMKEIYMDKTIRIYWATGKENFQKINQELKTDYIKVTDVVKPYFSNMIEIMAAADLVVCRAGALTISEVIELEKPTILIPYGATKVGQYENAMVLSEKSAGLVYSNSKAEEAIEKALELIKDENELEKMSRRIRKLKRVNPSEIIVENLDIWRN